MNHELASQLEWLAGFLKIRGPADRDSLMKAGAQLERILKDLEQKLNAETMRKMGKK